MLKPARRSDKDTLVVTDEEIHDEGDTPTSEMDLSMDTWFVQREKIEDEGEHGSENDNEPRRHDGCEDGGVYDDSVDGEACRERQTEDTVASGLSIHDKYEAKITPVKKRDDSSDKKKAKEGANKRGWCP